MAENRKYDHEYKVQAVKLTKKSDRLRLTKNWGFPKAPMYGWVRTNRLGSLDLGADSQSPQSVLSLNEDDV